MWLVRSSLVISFISKLILLIAQLRFTAVGLDFKRKSADLLRCSNEGFSNAAMYIPKAAATPIKGAPLTCISLIANSTSLTVFNVTTFNS